MSVVKHRQVMKAWVSFPGARNKIINKKIFLNFLNFYYFIFSLLQFIISIVQVCRRAFPFFYHPLLEIKVAKLLKMFTDES